MIQKDLVLIAKLASGITSVVSVSYLILTIFGLIFYFDCDAGTPGAHSDQFWSTVYRVYLQDADCNNDTFSEAIPEITSAHTIFVLTTLTLSFSFINLITSAALFFTIDDPSQIKYLKIYVYVYICSWVATFVIDVTLGTHFGIDVTNLGQKMNENSSYEFLLETIRIGAFFLMTIALKGYVIHLVSVVAIVLMLIFLVKHQEEVNKEMHSIYSQRALDAFEGYGTGVFDYESPPPRPFPEFHRRPGSSFRRAAPFPQQQQMPIQSVSRNLSDRPFSYLEERPAAKPTVAPSAYRKPYVAAPPPVPAPDYSPHSQRRLKSVLKPY